MGGGGGGGDALQANEAGIVAAPGFPPLRAYLRANLSAPSTASVPLLAKKTLSR